MKDNVKRLIARQCLDNEVTAPVAIREILATPHGLFGVSNLLMESYLNPDDNVKYDDIGILAGEYPLVSGVMLAGYIFDQVNAPSAISVFRSGSTEVSLGIPLEAKNQNDVLLVEEFTTDGYQTIQTVEALKAEGFRTSVVLSLAASDEAGLARITEVTGVPAFALFQASDFDQLEPEDHLYFRPDPNPNNGGYFWLNPEGDWEACSQDQNGYLEQYKEEQVPTTYEDEDNVFYLKGVLRV